MSIDPTKLTAASARRQLDLEAYGYRCDTKSNALEVIEAVAENSVVMSGRRKSWLLWRDRILTAGDGSYVCWDPAAQPDGAFFMYRDSPEELLIEARRKLDPIVRQRA